jgi:hypothetical protein
MEVANPVCERERRVNVYEEAPGFRPSQFSGVPQMKVNGAQICNLE